MVSQKNIPFINREISWLYFNARVLQEAADESVPLLERLKFLAIYSSNLEEFYRVRVATISRLSNINVRTKTELGFNPKKILNTIKSLVVVQERKFDSLFQQILTELAAQKIFILNHQQLNVSRGNFVQDYFKDNILSALIPIILQPGKEMPALNDRQLYFFVRLMAKTEHKQRYILLEIPAHLPRFVVLPGNNTLKYVILLEDVIQYCLPELFYIFQYDTINAYPIQVTRDAELDIDSTVSGKFIDELAKSISKRKRGKPMRLQYDMQMPAPMLHFLVKQLNVSADSLIATKTYMKFGDFIKFPNLGDPALIYKPIIPLRVSGLHRAESLLLKISKKDYLVNLPYQSYDYIILFLREAAIDPKVYEINITLYRLAENSKVINALINAARNGKTVYCLLEVKARFDEEANIKWGKRLREAGVVVNYGITDYKVHSKICLVKRFEKGKTVLYANLATGNFNEVTANIYCDHSLFTAKRAITIELEKLFGYVNEQRIPSGFKNLIVSPVDCRKKLNNLINREIRNAKAGKPAYMVIKVNSLADEQIIRKLYEASNANVKIQLVVRGICCLVPKVKGFSENITVISIIDKFLEHARIYLFANGGNELMYLSSGDLMTRNIDNRIEVGFPVLDADIRSEIRAILDFQLTDNTKARVINKENNNKYVKRNHEVKIRAQEDIYDYLKLKHPF